MIEILAKIDGYSHLSYIDTKFGLQIFAWKNQSSGEVCPDYCNSHDAVQRIIDKFSLEELQTYNSIVTRKYGIIGAYKMSPKQKCECVIEAMNDRRI